MIYDVVFSSDISSTTCSPPPPLAQLESNDGCLPSTQPFPLVVLSPSCSDSFTFARAATPHIAVAEVAVGSAEEAAAAAGGAGAEEPGRNTLCNPPWNSTTTSPSSPCTLARTDRASAAILLTPSTRLDALSLSVPPALSMPRMRDTASDIASANST